MTGRPAFVSIAFALSLAASPLVAAAADAPNREEALAAQANAAMQAGHWQEAADALTQITATDAKESFLEQLGDVQLRLGKFDDAMASYDRAIEAVAREPSLASDLKARNAVIGRLWTKQGNVQLKLKKFDLAISLYRRAAEVLPNPGTAWFNVCAVDYNTGQVDAALADCDKALSIDPDHADTWFIKGSLLLANAKTGKDGTVVAPGAAEALKKYLELAPNGPHADDVRQMLAYLAGPPKK